MSLTNGLVGETNNTDGANPIIRVGRQGDQIASELHGRFYEQTLRNRVFSGGMTLTAINNATYTSATTGVTMTPILGIYNPLTSGVNCEILQAVLGLTMTAVAATGGGPYVWMVNTGQSAISTGSNPFNRKSLTQTGAFAKNMANAALTGMSGALVILGGSSLCGGSAENASFTATAVAMQTQQVSSVENLDGSIIVPPGGVLVLAATTTPVAHSAASNLVWAEVPV
jgi:hypothetical protein